jgi:hypothetical protein
MAFTKYEWDTNDTNTAPLPAALQSDGYANGAIPKSNEFNEFWRAMSLWTKENEDKITAAEAILTAGISPGVVKGLVTANAADAIHDITISPGVAAASTLDEYLELVAPITKQIDAAWVPGDNLGGFLPGGSVTASTSYHYFIFKKDSDGSIDAGFDDNATCTNIPAGYTKFARVSSTYTDSSASIIPFRQVGNHFFNLHPDNLVYDAIATGTAAILVQVAPAGVEFLAIPNVAMLQGVPPDQTYLRMTSPNDPDLATTEDNCMFTCSQNLSAEYQSPIATNNLGQIRIRASQSSSDVRVVVRWLGWIDTYI